MIDLKQLQALRAVQGEGSVTRAARLLGWSQPTVDYHLRNLERLVGGPVLARTTRGSSLTPVGHLLCERGQEILTLSDRTLRDARDLTRMGQVRLRFGTFPTAAARLLPAVVAEVTDLGIDVDVVLEEVGPLVTHVTQRKLDAALIYSMPGYELPFRADVITAEVLRDPILLALPEDHPLAARASIDLPSLLALHDERWLLATSHDDPMDAIVVGAFAEAGHTLDVTIRTDDFQVMLGIVAARMAISFMPKLATGPVHPGVVLRPIDDPAFVRSVLLAAPAEAPGKQPSTAVRQVAAAIRHAVAGLE
ncbi:LysR family transcriptional regulator [Leucobacter zeae]|nr:LysR family transcriptional regulator [Leucobacter zeae]